MFQKVSAVIVGADRIAANGDTANKIGTLQLAIAASHFGIPFYIAAPTTTIDLDTKTGDEIPIEDRSSDEITLCKCSSKARIPPDGGLIRVMAGKSIFSDFKTSRGEVAQSVECPSKVLVWCNSTD